MPQQVLVLGGKDLIESLQSAGMPGGALEFIQADSGQDLLQSLHQSWDAVLIAWDAISGSPQELLTQITVEADVRIVVLAEQLDVDLVVNVLDWGADECLETQLSPREIVTHLRAQIRRATKYSQFAAEQAELSVGQLRVDLDRHAVTLDDETVELTPREFDLLAYMARNAGRAVPRAEIIEGVWAGEISANSRSLDVHVGRLRVKLEANPQQPTLISTVTGIGYRLEKL